MSNVTPGKNGLIQRMKERKKESKKERGKERKNE